MWIEWEDCSFVYFLTYEKNNLFSDKDQAQIRIISIGQLRMLPPFHTQPINVVVYNDS